MDMMKYRLTLLAAILLVFLASFSARARLDSPLQPEFVPLWECRRIVSMAPSITETLFALGLGGKVVGTSKFTTFPPEAANIPCVGGYLDPNFEAIIALRPDLVIMLKEQALLQPLFDDLKIETLIVNHQTVEGIIESFRVIGRVCGEPDEGRFMAEAYRRRLRDIRQTTEDLTKPRVLFVVDRTYGVGHPTDVYVVGDDDYLDKIIALAGGENLTAHCGVRYPVISLEAIIRLNPEVILDLAPPDKLRQLGKAGILRDWESLGELSAVRGGKVVILENDYARIPGPRFLRLVEELARTFHPEISWDRILSPLLELDEEAEDWFLPSEERGPSSSPENG